jgi:nucleoside-diphosphate-sugar epimerase
LIKRCERQSKPPFIIYISSTAVYGHIDGIADETTVCQPETPYGQSKLEAERYFVSRIVDHHLIGCILRPCMIYGEEGPGNLLRMMRLIARGWLPSFNGGTTLKSIVYVDNVVSAIMRCAMHQQQVNGQIYNVSDGVPLSMNQIATTLATGLDVRLRMLSLPSAPLQWGVKGWDRLTRWTGRLPQFGHMLDVYIQSSVVSSRKLNQELCFQPDITSYEGLCRTARWYRQHLSSISSIQMTNGK